MGQSRSLKKNLKYFKLNKNENKTIKMGGMQ